MIQVVASLTINPDEPEALESYFAAAMPLIENAGATVAQQIELGDPIVGETPSQLLMLVDYPSLDAVDAVFRSPAYQSMIPIRDRAFLKYNICYVSNNVLIELGD